MSDVARSIRFQEIEAALLLLGSWDFSDVRARLSRRHADATESYLLQAESRYRKFLALKKAHPEVRLVPTADIDMFWHEHILDTRRYGSDCELLFGEFLHHNPGTGTSDGETARWTASVAETAELWRRVYQEELFKALPGVASPGCTEEHGARRPQGCTDELRASHPQGCTDELRAGEPQGCTDEFRPGQPQGCTDELLAAGGGAVLH